MHFEMRFKMHKIIFFPEKNIILKNMRPTLPNFTGET